LTAIGPEIVLATFLLFCRIGACLMVMPGFSSPRVPMRVRLFVAIAVTLALAPPATKVQAAIPGVRPPPSSVRLPGVAGATIGPSAHVLPAPEFAGSSITKVIRLSNTADT
jgi:flagellar biosynthetic protein FliR